MKTLIFIFSVLLILCGCSTPAKFETKIPLRPSSDYYSLVEQNTKKNQVYDGFMNILDVSATFLSTETALAQVDHNAQVFQYNESQYQNEKSTTQTNLSRQTEIFISFFVPEKKYDDLAKKSSKWKIFLDVAGQRYEAKVVKVKGQLAELQSLYPHVSRWNTPYKIIFPVSTTLVENGAARLTLTGPVTSAALEFSPAKTQK